MHMCHYLNHIFLLLQRRNKDLTCSSEDDENSSYVSSTEAAETRTLLYISKIQKLELQLKKLKQENLALKEKGKF